MALTIIDFIEQVDGISTEDIPLDERERINDALADLTGGPGGGGAPVNNDAILVSKNLDGRAGFTSIQDAIDGENSQNSASGAGEDDTIFVEPGEYSESVTIDVDGLTLEGAGASATTIDAGGAEFGVEIVADEVSVRGFQVEGFEVIGIFDDPEEATVLIEDNVVTDPQPDPDGATVQAIQLTGGDGSQVIDNTVESVPEFEGEDFDSSGILAENADNAEIRNNTVDVEDIGIGISTFFGDATGNTIEGNDVTSEVSTGITVQANAEDNSASDTEIIDNTIDDSSTGLSLVDSGGDITGTNVTDNDFVDNDVHVEDEGDFVTLSNILDDNTFDPAGKVEETQIVTTSN